MDTETEFTGHEWCLNSGDKLARAIRVSPSEHKVINAKLREKSGDTRYRVNQICPPTQGELMNRINRPPIDPISQSYGYVF